MARIAKDLVKFTATNVGVTDFGIGAASAGFMTPATASIPDGSTVHYAARTATEGETGEGIYSVSGVTISRVTIYATVGTLSGGKVNFGSTPVVTLAPLSESFGAVAFSNDVGDTIGRIPSTGLGAARAALHRLCGGI